MGWSGRAPAPPATNLARGATGPGSAFSGQRLALRRSAMRRSRVVRYGYFFGIFIERNILVRVINVNSEPAVTCVSDSFSHSLRDQLFDL
jgi:hypothetical protein